MYDNQVKRHRIRDQLDQPRKGGREMGSAAAREIEILELRTLSEQHKAQKPFSVPEPHRPI